MKEFNLEEALAGKPVLCRNGELVTQIVEFKNTSAIHSLAGLCDDMIKTWTIDGNYFSKGTSFPSDWDLFMAPEKKSIWVNVYTLTNGDIMIGCSYKTKKGAIQSSDGDDTYIKTIEITNEI
jgi:hypothetical protein